MPAALRVHESARRPPPRNVRVDPSPAPKEEIRFDYRVERWVLAFVAIPKECRHAIAIVLMPNLTVAPRNQCQGRLELFNQAERPGFGTAADIEGPNQSTDSVDALYGGLYYRLMIGSGPLSDACVRGIFSAVLDGLHVRED
jgi:hypothetical protein